MAGTDLCIGMTALGDAVRLSVAGDLDFASAPYLRAVLQQACGEQAWVDVDMSAVTFIDCAGLRPLTEAYAPIGPRFAVVSPSRTVVRFFSIVTDADLLAAPPEAGWASRGTPVGDPLVHPVHPG